MDKVRELTNERIRDSDGECYINIIEREEKMNLGRYLCESKEKFVLIKTKNKLLIASGNPKEIFVMLSVFILKNKVIKVIQEIDDFPYSVIIDCEVVIK